MSAQTGMATWCSGRVLTFLLGCSMIEPSRPPPVIGKAGKGSPAWWAASLRSAAAKIGLLLLFYFCSRQGRTRAHPPTRLHARTHACIRPIYFNRNILYMLLAYKLLLTLIKKYCTLERNKESRKRQLQNTFIMERTYVRREYTIYNNTSRSS